MLKKIQRQNPLSARASRKERVRKILDLGAGAGPEGRGPLTLCSTVTAGQCEEPWKSEVLGADLKYSPHKEMLSIWRTEFINYLNAVIPHCVCVLNIVWLHKGMQLLFVKTSKVLQQKWLICNLALFSHSSLCTYRTTHCAPYTYIIVICQWGVKVIKNKI